VEHHAGRERVRETVRTGSWLHVYEDLSGRDPVSLGAVELEALAEAAWWLCRTDESIAARRRSYAGFRDAGDDRGAARTAARLFHDHFYRGEGAVAPLPRGARRWRSERESASEAGGRVGVCPGLYDNPHRRSLTGGAHSSSRLAPMTLTPLSRCRTSRLVSACIRARVGPPPRQLRPWRTPRRCLFMLGATPWRGRPTLYRRGCAVDGEEVGGHDG